MGNEEESHGFSCANERDIWRIAVEDDGKKSEALLSAN